MDVKPDLKMRLSVGPSAPFAPSPSPSAPTSARPPTSKDKKRVHSGAVKSTPAPAAPAEGGSGAVFNANLMRLISFLKTNQQSMFGTDDLAIRSGVTDLEYNEELSKALRAHDRVEYNAKTELYSFKPEYLIRNKQEALQRIQAYEGRGGMPFKVLEDSWKDAKQGIEELERDGRVLVSRTTVASTSTREPQIKMVFMDEVGKIDPPIEKAFIDAWMSLKTPAPEDLAQELRVAGLRTTVTVPGSTVPIAKKKPRNSNHRKVKKFTNTHMQGQGIDLSKDYVAEPGKK